MGNWIFVTGASGSGGLNSARRFVVYDTVADTYFYTEAFPETLPETFTFPAWLAAEVMGDYFFVSPGGGRVNLLNVQPYYTLNGAKLDAIGTISKQVVSEYDYPSSYNLVYLGNKLFWVFTYADPSGHYYTLVYRVNADATVTLYSTHSLYTTHPGVVSVNGKLYLFYLGTDGLIRYLMSTNGASWTEHTTTAENLGAFNSYFYSSLSVTYGFVYVNKVLSNHGAFTDDGGLTWTEADNVPDDIIFVVADANGVFVSDGVNIYKSVDGVTWTNLGQPLSGGIIYNIEYGNSMYMIVGEFGAAVTTTDFNSFTPFTAVDFELNHIYGATYTTESVSLEPVVTGTGTISGLLRLDTASGDFAARPVILYTYPEGDKVATVTSDATTGEWEFTQVPPGDYFYTAVPSLDDIEAHTRDFDSNGIVTVT